jgi:integrase
VARIFKFGGKRMRARGQAGQVEKRGSNWYGHFYIYVRQSDGTEKRHHRGLLLGKRSEMDKVTAKDRLRAHILSTAGTTDTKEDDTVTLRWFTNNRYLPMRAPQWAPSTRETNLYYIEKHILRALGETALADINKFKCQMFINQLAKDGFSFTVVDHCRTILKAILEEAIEADLTGKNPARKLVNPDTPASDKQVLPKEQARALIQSLQFRDRLVMMIAAFCAMRPGEIFGLRWSSWRGDHFQVEGTVWRGILRPGKAKTRHSKAPVAIPDILLPALRIWRDQNATAPEDALIFPSEAGTPMRPENWLRRRITPFAKAAGITVNFQVLRRTFATNAQGHGNPKDVQTHLRHTDIGTTLDVYTQSIPESVRKLVNAVTDEVVGKSAAELWPVELTRWVQ